MASTIYVSSTIRTRNRINLEQLMKNPSTTKDSIIAKDSASIRSGADLKPQTSRKGAGALAIVRPFSPKEVSKIVNTFASWEDYSPCREGHNGDAGSGYGKVDFFLSYSQTLHDAVEVKETLDRMIASFRSEKNASPWNGCINEIYAIDAHIAPEEDVYIKEDQDTNPMWVNGPNQHFLTTLNEMRNGVHGIYDAVFLMEDDTKPIRQYWLDSLLEEIEETDFAILGR
jgi:hypothetical protein